MTHAAGQSAQKIETATLAVHLPPTAKKNSIKNFLAELRTLIAVVMAELIAYTSHGPERIR